MRKLVICFSLVMSLFCFSSCGDDDEVLDDANNKKNEVVTKDVIGVTSSSATLCCEVSGNVESSAIYGFFYGDHPNITSSDKLIVGTVEGKVIKATITSLTKDKVYYYRAFARSMKNGIYVLGEEKSFVCSPNSSGNQNQGGDEKDDNGGSQGGTSGNVDVDYFSAKVKVVPNVSSGVSLYEVGVIYSTDSNPTKANGKVVNKSVNTASDNSKEFEFSISDLTINTTYYYVSYTYTYSDGKYKYGDVKKFSTLDVSDEPVNMGTSVKWARCNIGAKSPEECDYYAWGETATKDVYSKDTYIYYNNGTYADLGKDISGTAFDVAHVKLGGNWRMPKKSELEELRSICRRYWIKYNGVVGCLFVNETTNNSIFLPASGYRWNGSLYNRGSGYYWSSSLSEYGPGGAWYLDFSDGGVGSSYSYGRYNGFAVRAVCQ